MMKVTVSDLQLSGDRSSAAGANVPSGEPAFSVVQADGLERLCRASSTGLHPPFPLPGAPFFPDLLSLSGVDVSFVKVAPGDGSPYLMRHRRNEVVYIVAEGRGEFLIDGEAISVRGGAVVRVRPEAVRAWRNTSGDDLCLIVVQARAGRFRWPRRSDIVGLPGRIRWSR